MALVIHLPAKKLSEDRSFQEAFSVAIVDEIATKETPQMQQKQTLQPVSEVSKDSSFSPLHVLRVANRDKVLIKIRCLQARRWHTLVFWARWGQTTPSMCAKRVGSFFQNGAEKVCKGFWVPPYWIYLPNRPSFSRYFGKLVRAM